MMTDGHLKKNNNYWNGETIGQNKNFSSFGKKYKKKDVER